MHNGGNVCLSETARQISMKFVIDVVLKFADRI